MADPPSRRLRAAAAADLTYAEVGATGGELPGGYGHVHRLVDLGEGPALFAAAAARLLTWQVHRAAGLTVEATGPRAVAFSLPATWWGRLGAPVGRRVQDRITDRYVLRCASGSPARPRSACPPRVGV